MARNYPPAPLSNNPKRHELAWLAVRSEDYDRLEALAAAWKCDMQEAFRRLLEERDE